MLYKGCVSCSSLMSSVGEMEMILLGFREAVQPLNWEKYKVTAFYSVLSTFLALFSCLQVTPIFFQLTRPLLLGVRQRSLLAMSPLTDLHCPAPQANLRLPRALQIPQRGSTMRVAFQPSKQGYLCIKKMSSESWPLLVSFSTNHCNSPWTAGYPTCSLAFSCCT